MEKMNALVEQKKKKKKNKQNFILRTAAAKLKNAVGNADSNEITMTSIYKISNRNQGSQKKKNYFQKTKVGFILSRR
jgi:hypothetical protein